VVVDEQWPGFEALPPSPPTERPERRIDQASSEPGRRRARRRWLALAAAAVAVVVVVTMVMRTDGDESSETATPAPTSTVPGFAAPPTSSPSTSTTPPDPSPLQDEVATLSAFVERERGLVFKGAFTVALLSDDEFRSRVDQMWPVRDDQAQEALLKAFGVIGPEVPYAHQLHDLRLESTAAYYDPDADRLVLRDREVDEVFRSTIVHELTHALDDQWFGLVRPEYADADDEIALGFRSLVEGDATRVEHAYIDALPPDQRWDYRSGPAPVPNGVDPVIADAFWDPYDLGEALVVEVLGELGQPGLDAAFVDPPTTSEQVRYPTKYIDREGRLPVAPPRADGRVVDDGVMGLMLTEAMLSPLLDAERARIAAAGWGGDWYVSWLDDDEALQCWRTDYVMDSEQDVTELLAALRTWVANGPHRTVEVLPSDTLRVTACGPPPPNDENRD
jgi:hypothetical protein